MAENNTFVADASFVLSLLLPDEKMLPFAKKNLKLITEPYNKMVSSTLLEYEVGNALRSAILRKRIKKSSLNTLSKNYKLLPITINKINFDNALSLSIQKNLSFYDGSYLYLAKSLNAKLLTLDEKLSKLANF